MSEPDLAARRPARCAVIARADGYRPAGTAASAPIFLLIEVPRPWPAEVTQHPLLQPVAPIATAHQARVQALVPDPLVAATPEGMTRVVVYRRPEGPFQRFVRDEHVVPTLDLAPSVERLLAGAPEAAGSSGISRGSATDVPRDSRQDPAGRVTDVLVCTHGQRDVCCGGDGSRMHRDLVALGPTLPAVPAVRVWRTSHTGGHRFAPTAMTFPDGRAWATVDAVTLAAIVSRSIDPAAAVAHDRGCAAFADPFAQAADGAVLGAEGWRWLEMARTARTEILADNRRTVTLTAHRGAAAAAHDRSVGPDDDVVEAGWGLVAGDAPAGPSTDSGGVDSEGADSEGADSEAVVYRVEVVVRRVVPVPDCGRPIEEARKSSQELDVVSLTRSGRDTGGVQDARG